MSIDCDPIDEAIFDIEDYVGGNIEGIDKVDRMAFTVFLRKTLTTAISTAVREARIDELEHIISGSEYSDDDFDWYEITKDEYVGTKYYSEVRHLDKDSRIAQLKEGVQE